MSDNLRESISALVDSEAQEFELHRVLSSMENDEQVRQTWKRYQTVSFAMKRQVDGRFDLDISQRVTDAIAEEPVIATKSRISRLFNPVVSMAVAASAAFLVIFAVQQGANVESNPPLASVENTQPANLLTGVEQSAASVLNQDVMTVSAESMTPVQQRLRSLMESHTQQASLSQSRGVMPYTQLVEADESQGY